nr:response regulator transcription factor [uncultured Sphingosinicella sp.]
MATSAPHLLLVEDDPATLHVLEATLEYGGFASDVATTALDALQRLNDRSYDAVLLDLGLPDLDGSHLIKTLRTNSDVPIMVVSGRGTEQDKIASLDLGADDFVAKPFLPGELLARIRAVLRRRGPSLAMAANDIIEENGGPAPAIPDGDVRFARLEGNLFKLLEGRGDDVVTYDDIIEAIWGRDKPRGQSHVRVLVGQLRRKLELQNSPYKIRSERGAGYRLWKSADA